MNNNQAWDKEKALSAFLDTIFNAYPSSTHFILVIDAERRPDGAVQATLSVNPQCSEEYWVKFNTPPDWVQFTTPPDES